MKSTRKTRKGAPGLQKVNSDKKSTLSQRSKSTLVNGLVNDDVAVTSANDVAVMTSLGLTSVRGIWRVIARGRA